MVQWLNVTACLEIRDRGFVPRSGIQVAKKQNVSSLPTPKDPVL